MALVWPIMAEVQMVIEYNFPAQSLSQLEKSFNLWIIRDAQAYSNYFGAEMWTQMSYVIDESGWGIGQMQWR